MLTPNIHKNSLRFDPSQFASVLYWIDAGDTKDVGDGTAITAASAMDKSSYKRGALQSSTFPVYKANGGNLTGRPYWSFNGSSQHMRTPSFSVTHPRIFFVATPTGLDLNGRYWDGNTVNTCYMNMAGIPAGVQINGSTAAQCKTLCVALDTTKVNLYDAKFNGASSSLQVDENTKITGSVGTASTSSGFNLGAAGNLLGGYFKAMNVYEFIVCDDDALTADQIDYIRRGLIAKHRIRTRNLVYADGNSWIAGQGSTAGNDMVSMVTRGFGDSTFVLKGNDGVGGAITTALPHSSGLIDLYFSSFRSAALIIWEARNEIYNSGGTPVTGATAYADMKTVLQARQTAGWKGPNAPTPGNKPIILLDIDTSGTMSGAAMLTEVNSYNALVAANTAGSGDKIADALIHIDGLGLGAPAADSLHYNDAQYAVIATAVVNALKTLGAVIA